MTNYLYYPETAAPLERIVPSICPSRADPEAFSARLLSVNQHVISAVAVCTARTPILIPDQSAAFLNLAPLLACTPQQHYVLAMLTKALSGGVVAGLAEFLWQTKLLGMAKHLYVYGGDGLGADNNLGNGLLQALDQYDRAITHYDGLLMRGVDGLMLDAAGKRVMAAIEKTNTLANLKSQQAYKKFSALLKRSPQPSISAVNQRIPILENRHLQNLVSLAKGLEVINHGVVNLGGDIGQTNLSASTQALLTEIQADFIKSGSLPFDGASATTLVALSAAGLIINIDSPGSHAQKLQRLQHRFV
ncbi:hypothetical protein [Halioxenophilus aromaticivorans]|uniref:Uncharacterized protein n=1 Tax=Halioxenophilus aromaticivorans TaxID=1306992 RepID=A0AAV3UAG6_9ALTE